MIEVMKKDSATFEERFTGQILHTVVLDFDL